MTTETLLIEIGTEELPPKALPQLASALAENFAKEADNADLVHGNVRWLASPRRLAVIVEQLVSGQPDKVVEKRGPSVNVAFDADGNPTKAAQGWARSNGITVEQAERLENDKGAWLLHRAEVKGRSTVELVPELLEKALRQLPVPRPMRWGNNDTQFIRPVHTLTLLYGADVIPATLLGHDSARSLQGHRFHCNGYVELDHAEHYEQVLKEKGYVIADFATRRALIAEQVQAAASAEGGLAQMDDDLLDEVTGLVEWPVTLVGGFEERFLEVPPEALIYTMKDNQKYFPMVDADGQLLPRFIFVSNIASKDPQQVIAGNEKVVRPRLADAEFFFNTDKKQTLAARVDSLANVLFQKQLGTLKEKSERISQLAGEIAHQLGADPEQAQRAGLLSKTDLMTEMVMEFPDVQGIMGKHYARLDGEAEAVALALDEQYMPRFAGDQLPTGYIGAAVALADKLDTLVGIFGINQPPKGDKDPFALRRAALGILRITVEKNLPLDIEALAEISRRQFGDKLKNSNVVTDVVDFVLGRFRAWYQDQGVTVDVIQAVLAKRPTRPADFDARVKAVVAFQQLDAAAALAETNKRVSNMLAKTENIAADASIDNSLLQDPAEQQLAQHVQSMQTTLLPLFEQGNYTQALEQLASLRDPIDEFFKEVMVMADDEALRKNRLILLQQLRSLFMYVADIALLQH